MLRCLVTIAVAAQALAASAAPAGGAQRQTDATPRATHQALLHAYVTGDADAAVAELATWTVKQIDADSLPSGALHAQSAQTLRAVVLMHTEAMLKQTVRPPLDAHLRIVRAAMEELSWRKGMDAFCDSLQVIASSFLVSVGLITEARRIPDLPHPDLLLLSGSIAETLASDHVFQRPGSRSAPTVSTLGFTRNSGNVLLLEAEQKFRAALKSDPSLVEARLRLGRVLDLQGRADVARGELERALQQAGTGYERYLAALFLGSLHERSRRYAPAMAAYRTAIREYPESQTPYLALAHVLETQGNRDSAWDTLRTMVKPQAKRADPWWVYCYAQYWQIGTRVAGLRAAVRQ